MDARRKDNQGRTICPSCNKAYFPKLGERDPNTLIQHQFPNATPSEREELVTGYCTKCQKGIFTRDPSENCRVIKHFIVKKDNTSKGFSYDQAVNWR